MTTGTVWLFIGLGIAVVLAYEAYFRSGARRMPERFARATHARLRADWVASLMQERGNELLAVQTIRNSVMSATVTASTAVLALMGAISLFGGRLVPGHDEVVFHITPAAFLTALLVMILAAAFAFATMAVRFYNHAGYLMSMRTQGGARDELIAVASRYMVRAGNYYSMGLRTLFWIMPAAVGLVNVRLMPLAALALCAMLAWFDRAPETIPGHPGGGEKP